ncbi:hypothetical protein Tco_0472138 [Tanacetum coccineum]
MSMQSSSNQIGLHLPNPDKSLQFRPIKVSESENLFLDHIHGEDKNVEDVQMADHLRPMEELLQIPIVGKRDMDCENVPLVLHYIGMVCIKVLAIASYPHLKNKRVQKRNHELSTTGENLMSKNTQEALTIIENKAKDRTCRNKPQVLSNGGTSTQIDAIAALTKQVEALGYHIASMQETYDHNQEAAIQLMQNQMGQMAKAFQERPSCVPPSNIKSSGSITSHSDLSLLEYESFHFDCSINQLPPADRSDSRHEEFADKLAHIISPPEYDHFYFDLKANLGELTIVLKRNISETLTNDLKINELNDFPLFLSDCDSISSKKFSEIDLLVLFSFGNKDRVFDPRIFTINGVHSKRFSILLLDDFSFILFIGDFLFMTDCWDFRFDDYKMNIRMKQDGNKKDQSLISVEWRQHWSFGVHDRSSSETCFETEKASLNGSFVNTARVAQFVRYS